MTDEVGKASFCFSSELRHVIRLVDGFRFNMCWRRNGQFACSNNGD